MSDDMITVYTVTIVNDEGESEAGSRVHHESTTRDECIAEAQDEALSRYNENFTSMNVRMFMHITYLPVPKMLPISAHIEATLGEQAGARQVTATTATIA